MEYQSSQDITHSAADLTWGHGGEGQRAGNIGFRFECAGFKTHSRCVFRSFYILYWCSRFVDVVMKCWFPYFLAWESAAVTGIYPCVVQPHNFNRICLKWDRLSNKKETAVSICHLHMSSSVDYVKPLKLNRHMCILERSFGYFFIIQAFCKLPSHFTKCLVIL